MRYEQEPDQVVHITLDKKGLPVPDVDPIPVKKGRQKIEWCADFDFSIDVDGYNDVQHGPGSRAFGAKTGHFMGAPGTKHKYSITANGVTNDPEIDVKP
jgi:hypothetical protein